MGLRALCSGNQKVRMWSNSFHWSSRILHIFSCDWWWMVWLSLRTTSLHSFHAFRYNIISHTASIRNLTHFPRVCWFSSTKAWRSSNMISLHLSFYGVRWIWRFAAKTKKNEFKSDRERMKARAREHHWETHFSGTGKNKCGTERKENNIVVKTFRIKCWWMYYTKNSAKRKFI